MTGLPGFSKFRSWVSNFFNNFGTSLYGSSLFPFLFILITAALFLPSSARADATFPLFEAVEGGLRFNLPQIYISIDPDDLWDDVIGLMVGGEIQLSKHIAFGASAEVYSDDTAVNGSVSVRF